MCMQRKIFMLLVSACMMINQDIYSKTIFHLPGISFETEDIAYAYDYVCKTIYNHPITITSLGVAAVASLYCIKRYSKLFDLSEKMNKQELLMPSLQNPKHFSETQHPYARWYYPGRMSTKFKDVAGMHEAKAEIYDFVDFLKDSKQFLKMGAKIPKGVLLAGPPGTDKTLLARAVAGEANVPLCYVNASEFMEALVGVGAARVRELFRQAKAQAPCIIFIDEIDTIGRKRSSGSGSDNEAAQTLNQLLAEMDGFETHKDSIVVMAATNRIEVLDSALIRPGRFDRHVHVRKPELKDRIEILYIYLRSVPTDVDCDLVRLARITRGCTGADLACLVNDAAILAVRQKSSKVAMAHFQEAYDNMMLGRVCKHSMEITDQDLWETAVHEAGHALLYVYQKDSVPLYRVSIHPRGNSLGVTHGLPEVERHNDSYERLFAKMVAALGGAVAEEMVYNNRGTGAISDLQKVRMLAIDIVAKYGMSDEFKNVTFVMHEWQDLSPEIRDRLEIEIHKLIAKAQNVAEQLLEEHRLELDALVALLLEKLVVTGDEVYELCGVDKPIIDFSLS